MRGCFIAIEGNDATGKTTLATLLAEALPAERLATPPAALRPVRRDIDQCYEGHGLAGQLFYASTVAYVADVARLATAKGRHVVVDRYWLSTCAYDALRDGAISLDAVARGLFPADATILLETPEPERLRRMHARGASPADLAALPHAALVNRRLRDGLGHPLAGRGLVLDTGSLGPEACAAHVRAWLCEQGLGGNRP